MRERRYLVVVICLAWATAIFLTSSTVVTPQAFFDWFHENIFRNDEAFLHFQLFWGVSWLFVVKGWHVTEFAVLMLLATGTLDALTKQASAKNVLTASLLCITYAASDEWHQTFVPQRGGVLDDVLIDSLGTLIPAFFLLRRRRISVSR